MSQATDLQNRLIEAIQKKYPKSRMFRQNNGKAYPLTSFQRALPFLIKNVIPVWLRPVAYGVVGQGDVGGWIHIDGVAVAAHVEVKIGPDRQSEEQKTFEATIKRCGGIYVVARELEPAMRDLDTAIAELKRRYSA